MIRHPELVGFACILAGAVIWFLIDYIEEDRHGE